MAISAEDVKMSGWKIIMHLNYGGGGYGYRYRSVKFPSVVICIDRPKRKQPEKRLICVGKMEVPDFQAAADLLNAEPAAAPSQGSEA